MADAPTNPLLDLLRNIQQIQQDHLTPVEVVKGEILTGDVELADGTKLRVRVVVSQVNRVANVAGPGGRPLYSVETAVVPTVLEWKR